MRITFILADTHSTYLRLIHENEHAPYKRRTVTIDLTLEQCEKIRPREVGEMGLEPKFEEILDCFIENDKPAA